MSTFTLKILRGTQGKQYIEEYELKRKSKKNIISYLNDIQANPVPKAGLNVEPVVWEQSCLEEVCGSCSMLINGKPRQACSFIVENNILETGKAEIFLAPFTKFPLVRDLVVDRTRMLQSLKKMQAWIDVDNYHSDQPAPKYGKKEQELMYALSQCILCGCCCEVCPKYEGENGGKETSSGKFAGAFAVGQAVKNQLHPNGSKSKLPLLGSEEGITNCGKSQNCDKVCPKNIPLVETISLGFRMTVKDSIRKFFSRDT